MEPYIDGNSLLFVVQHRVIFGIGWFFRAGTVGRAQNDTAKICIWNFFMIKNMVKYL